MWGCYTDTGVRRSEGYLTWLTSSTALPLSMLLRSLARWTGRSLFQHTTGRPFWQSMCYKCVGIKALHHLRFSSSHKGYVFARERSNSQEEAIIILKDNWSPLATDLPPHILPSGCSPSRQWYPYNKIREFCPDQCKDHTCPKPYELEPPSGSLPTTPSLPSYHTTLS